MTIKPGDKVGILSPYRVAVVASVSERGVTVLTEEGAELIEWDLVAPPF